MTGGIKVNGTNVVIGIENFQEVERELGKLKYKTPAVTKFAINKTARYARKMMIMQAKARYAVNAAGAKHLDDLVQRKKATNANMQAELHIESLKNDLGYFETNPTSTYTGIRVFKGPDAFTARVLKSSPMKALTGSDGRYSKGFLIEFRNSTGNNHIGMVQRDLRKASKHTTTKRGYRRWTNKKGKVEPLVTLGSPSAAAMHHTIWPMVSPDVETFLEEALIARAEQVLAVAQAKAKKG